jgi:mannose-6-phosphate isomerase-like protein (cupin superfamily)
MKTVFAFALIIGLAFAAGAVAAEKGVVSPASEVKWMDNPAMKGAAQAVLWGDPAKGAYGAFKKVPGGTVLGPHTHANDQRAIMISGTMEFNFEGEAKKELGAGSYVSIPGGAVHDATCKAGADCVYLEESVGAADFKPVMKK